MTGRVLLLMKSPGGSKLREKPGFLLAFFLHKPDFEDRRSFSIRRR